MPCPYTQSPTSTPVTCATIKTVYVVTVFFLSGLDFMRLILSLLALLILASACAPANQPATLQLPTLAVLPSLTPAVETTAAPPTDTPPPTVTAPPTATPSPTTTPSPTRTPRSTETPRPTIEPTRAAIGTATEAVLEAPRFATFTPAPGGQPPGTPAQLADVVITERQFQEALDARLVTVASIDRAVVDFVPGAINVELTALGGEALTTGIVTIAVELTGEFATISISDIRVNAPEPPPVYVETISADFFPAVLETLDSILEQRLGPNQKLRSIAVTDTAVEATLLVPQG